MSDAANLDDKKDEERPVMLAGSCNDGQVARQTKQGEVKEMAARTRRTAAPAPVEEPVVEETETTTSSKRGPGPLAEAHYAWITAEYGDVKGVELLYLAQTTRREFRATEDYQTALEAVETARQEAEDAKIAAAEARAAKAAEKAASEPAETTVSEEAEAPKPAGRRRKPATTSTETAPAAAPARRRAAKATAPAAEPVAEETAAPAATPARRSRAKAPF